MPKKKRRKLGAFLRKACLPLLIFCLLLLLFWSLLPYFVIHRAGLGLFVPAACCLLGLAAICFRRPLGKLPGKARLLRRGVTVLVLLFGTAFVVTSALMIAAAAKPAKADSTVIVLGCKVDGTGPSLMLYNRIQAAYAYLSQNENSYCIATGAQGPNEGATEASVIKRCLMEKGIAGERILLDEQSTNTQENIHNAKELITEEGLPTDAVIVTDEFHQLRSHMIAAKEDLEPTTKSSHTPWFLFIYYWFREMFALAQQVLLK